MISSTLSHALGRMPLSLSGCVVNESVEVKRARSCGYLKEKRVIGSRTPIPIRHQDQRVQFDQVR